MTIHCKYINSSQNNFIKGIKKLQKSNERKKTGNFIIEGLPEIKLAIQAGFEIKNLIFPINKFSEEEILDYSYKYNIPLTNITLVDEKVFNNLAYRENTKNAIAIAKMKIKKLIDIKLNLNPLIVVVEKIEKPGNLGAILRTCDAADIDALILCDPNTDIFNPNVIRASLGTIFTNQLVTTSTEEAIKFLKNKNIKIAATVPSVQTSYTQINFNQPIAIALGTEATGLSKKWIQLADYSVSIPMTGKVDSLNVSVSAGILIYEAIRQRNQNK